MPGRNGEPGFPGQKGERGFEGTRGLQGLPGLPGPKGREGRPCQELGDYLSGILLVRHSQSVAVPDCPPGQTKLWDGYSLLYIEGNEKAHHQDLGFAGTRQNTEILESILHSSKLNNFCFQAHVSVDLVQCPSSSVTSTTSVTTRVGMTSHTGSVRMVPYQ